MASKSSGNANGKPIVKIGFYHAVRDVLIAAMARGQLLLMCAFLVLFVVVIRLPPDQLSAFVFRIMDGLANGSYLGWGLFGLTAIGWGINARFLRRINATEMQRVADAKTAAQQAKLGQHVRSSEV